MTCVTRMTRISMVCFSYPAFSAKRSVCVLSLHIPSHHFYSPFSFTVLNCLEDLPIIQTGEKNRLVPAMNTFQHFVIGFRNLENNKVKVDA